MNPEKLVSMANAVAAFFAPRGHAATVAGVADHLKKFWDPRMRQALAQALDAGQGGAEAAVVEAMTQLRSPP